MWCRLQYWPWFSKGGVVYTRATGVLCGKQKTPAVAVPMSARCHPILSQDSVGTRHCLLRMSHFAVLKTEDLQWRHADILGHREASCDSVFCASSVSMADANLHCKSTPTASKKAILIRKAPCRRDTVESTSLVLIQHCHGVTALIMLIMHAVYLQAK